jgi:hypothetical protein
VTRLLATVVVSCEKTGVHDFVARFYDTASETFYSGAARTALEAVAWAFDDYCARAIFGLPHAIARNTGDVPGSRFDHFLAAAHPARAAS